MQNNESVQFFITLAKLQAQLTRKFDNRLGGVSLNEFIILLELAHAGKQRLRRIDLAERVGLTASGITRLLLPMEKVGLVKKELDPADARASFVRLASGGKRVLTEALDRAEQISDELIDAAQRKKVSALTKDLTKLIRI